MKFTKVTSAALLGATALSILAPATSSFAATQEGNADANGGKALPQQDKTIAGISFGDNKPNGNTGYLRLQMVPHILDFGNHVTFDNQYPTFFADGTNYGKADNNRNAGYKTDDPTNKTAILNTRDSTDPSKPMKGLEAVEGTAWATVVDKQTTRDQAVNDIANGSTTDADGNEVPNTKPNDSKSGSWQLYVRADGPMQAIDDAGKPTGEAIKGATLMLKNTQQGQTNDIYRLTNEAQDSDYKDTPTLTPATATSNIDVTDGKGVINDITKDINGDGGMGQLVADAKADQGAGANVFGWDRSNIQLTLPASTKVVSNAVYESSLTWTLATGIA